jgi:threonine dehydrogenase-like Zn-dependent dehydrogenase
MAVYPLQSEGAWDMKAAVVSVPGKLEIWEIARPQPGPYDCLVKIDACAICTGTDTSIAFKRFPWRSPYPFVLGHESTGLVLECGPEVRYFKPGQRVTRPAAVLAGDRVDGISSTWGGFAEFGLVRDTRAAFEDGLPADGMHAASRVPIPPGVDAVSAALSVNQREIISVVDKMPGLDSSARLAVIGSGYNGLLFSLLGKHAGAGRVVVCGSARLEERATHRFAADGYADYRDPAAAILLQEKLGGPPTHVIDAVGSHSSLELAHALLQPGAAFGCYGIDDLEETEAVRAQLARGFNPLDMGANEAACVERWHALWQNGFFAPPGMVDNIMPIEEMHAAFEILARREAVKIVISL